jgi:arylsulfatase A
VHADARPAHDRHLQCPELHRIRPARPQGHHVRPPAEKGGLRHRVAGKWQLGQERICPSDFGFDESYLWQHTRRPPRYANPGLEHNGVPKSTSTPANTARKVVNDFALDFVTRHRARPFFLYYPMILTHDPFQPTPDSADWDPKTKASSCSGREALRGHDDLHGQDDRPVRGQARRARPAREHAGHVHRRQRHRRLGDLAFQGRADYPGGKGTGTARGTHVPFIANWPARSRPAASTGT